MKRWFDANSRLWMILLVAACSLFLFPLFREGFFISDDGEWMVIRLSAFYQSLAEGQFPVRFLGRLNNSYGYPVANFLYPGFLYIGSLLHAAGLSFVESIKAILGASIIGTTIVLYRLLRHYQHRRLTAAAGVLGFLFSPYIVYDLYRRGSVGEILAFFPASLVFYSIAAGKRLLLPFAVGFLIVSHNTVALITLAAAFAFIVYRRQWEYVWWCALGIALASFFWIPALREQSYVLFNSVAVSDPFVYFPVSLDLIAASWVWIVAAILLVGQKRLRDENFWLILLISCVLLATPVLQLFWQTPLLSRLVQFPYRFLGLAALAAPIVVAGSLGAVGRKKTIVSFLYVAAWIVFAVRIAGSIDPIIREEGFYTTNEGTTTVANEYMPVWVRELPASRATNRIEIVSGDAEFSIAKATTQSIDVTVESQTETVVQINTVYYPGWGIIVDGQPVNIDYGNPQGLMRVTVPTGSHRIIAEFRETVSRFAADAVSFLAAIVYGIILAAGMLTGPKNKKKKRTR